MRPSSREKQNLRIKGNRKKTSLNRAPNQLQGKVHLLLVCRALTNVSFTRQNNGTLSKDHIGNTAPLRATRISYLRMEIGILSSWSTPWGKRSKRQGYFFSFLTTYPSPKTTSTLPSHLGQNVAQGSDRWAVFQKP